jgi:phage terminase large subunit-like protein
VTDQVFDPDLPMRWTPAAQERLLELMSTEGEHRVWYCTDPGRTCDGEPHEGYPYRHARSDQWPPSLREDWMFWILLSGRGAGKTRAGAEWLRNMTRYTGRLSMIAPTAADLRDVMIEGESGILRVCEQSAGYVPIWEPSKKRLTFPNGAICIGYTAEEPDRLRGRNDGAGWLDEPGHYENVDYVWQMFMYGLRGGTHPRVAITTTPTPSQWIKDMLADPKSRVTRVSTFANEANLPPAFIEQMRTKFAGTRQGRQELFGEILEDVEGALWSAELLADTRVHTVPPLVRIVVGVDPAGTSIKRSDETGIVVAGKGYDGELYVLADYSGRYSPLEWAQAARDAYIDWRADAIVAETNYGGEMVEQNLRLNVGAFARYRMVNSRRGKFIRAEPVFGLFEQGRAHLAGSWQKLEDQLCSWVPGTGRSPDRLDALVHAAHELIDLDTTVAIARPRGRHVATTARVHPGGAPYTDLKRMVKGALG